MGDMKLKALIDMDDQKFKRFYKDFEIVANDFCDNDYVHSNRILAEDFL